MNRPAFVLDGFGEVHLAIVGVGKGMPSPSESFKVDRPYLVYVRDIQTGTILFSGRITSP